MVSYKRTVDYTGSRCCKLMSSNVARQDSAIARQMNVLASIQLQFFRHLLIDERQDRSLLASVGMNRSIAASARAEPLSGNQEVRLGKLCPLQPFTRALEASIATEIGECVAMHDRSLHLPYHRRIARSIMSKCWAERVDQSADYSHVGANVAKVGGGDHILQKLPALDSGIA